MGGWIGALGGLGAGLANVGKRQLDEAEQRRQDIRDENKAKAVAKYAQGLRTEENIRSEGVRTTELRRQRANARADTAAANVETNKRAQQKHRWDVESAKVSGTSKEYQGRMKSYRSRLDDIATSLEKGDIDEAGARRLNKEAAVNYGITKGGGGNTGGGIDVAAVAANMEKAKAKAKVLADAKIAAEKAKKDSKEKQRADAARERRMSRRESGKASWEPVRRSESDKKAIAEKRAMAATERQKKYESDKQAAEAKKKARLAKRQKNWDIRESIGKSKPSQKMKQAAENAFGKISAGSKSDRRNRYSRYSRFWTQKQKAQALEAIRSMK